jgi:hypothetical protein
MRTMVAEINVYVVRMAKRHSRFRDSRWNYSELVVGSQMADRGYLIHFSND